MILTIDGKVAVLKKGFSFEYYSENRLFKDRDDFSLNIDLPIRGCKENQAIFGNIQRKDALIFQLYYDAEIHDAHFHKSGAVTIISITDDMIRVQFLEGRSFQNFYPDFDQKFINELDLGNWDPSRSQTPAQMWSNDDIIALPWVNSYTGNIQNRADYNINNNTWSWHTTADDDDDTEVVSGLSCQIRLYTLTHKICDALGYELLAADWMDSKWYNLYSLNSTPYAWFKNNWADTLPHWTINEFFHELEKLMLCEFDINHKTKTISFAFSQDKLNNADEEHLTEIVDEYTHTLTKEDESDYKLTKNTGYQNCDNEMWNWYSCDWLKYEKNWGRGQAYSTLQQLLHDLPNRIANGVHRTPQGTPNTQYLPQGLLYAVDVDTSFALYEIGRVKRGTDQGGNDVYGSIYKLIPVNRFGNRIFDEDNYDSCEELKICPVWLDEAIDADNHSKGCIIFLSLGSLDNTSASGGTTHGRRPHGETVDQAVTTQVNLMAAQTIIDGKSSDDSAFNYMSVGFWYGELSPFPQGKLPAPWIDSFEIDWNFSVTTQATLDTITQSFNRISNPHNDSLRINNDLYGNGILIGNSVMIDAHKKYEFDFLSDKLPNARAIFNIKGIKYLCAQIKLDISENGLSQKKRGVFYRIKQYQTTNIQLAPEVIIEPTNPIPAEYNENEYISITGVSNYLITDFIPTNGCHVEIEFKGTAANSSKAGSLFGSRNGWNNKSFYFRTGVSSGTATDLTANMGFKTERTQIVNVNASDKHIYGIEAGRFYIDNETIGTYNETFTPDYPIYIMRINSAGSPKGSAPIGNLYYCKCWDDNGELVRDYRPVTRISDSVKGLFDIITQTFITIN